ncbi:alpha/beta fold hydrolase [Chitinophaga qingshengii]|uniref:Alpha/beta hydrolase n=1 Tax=Chitinophaga qingshengii TaxID=1569794 RepID=A0ABR7TY47_9BACT|nr:alpha/beta hydrolase [Chitinophaga qingshengii]MBC9935028.1 alpha/beta hydrolase [Chitinophaga qingshengii]
MKQLFTALFCLALFQAHAQTLYVKTYGRPKDKPVIFLHGGPGYNAVFFEATTAARLAGKGFFVIVYDRRGEGRSPDSTAKFTFDEALADIEGLYKTYQLKKAVLLGHSFGGVLALRYAAKHAASVDAIVLADALLSAQETYRTVLAKVKDIYEQKKDSMNLRYVAMIEQMDTAGLAYNSYTLGHAMMNGLYGPVHFSEEAKAIYQETKKDSLVKKYGSQMTRWAPIGYAEHEHYTTLNMLPELKNLVAKKVKVYAIYGKEDGLFSEKQVAAVTEIIGQDRIDYLAGAGHNVFADQQTSFLNDLQKWLK